MNFSGVVYVIKNNVTGDCYVGQTRQKSNTRWANHRTKLNSNLHHSKKLQIAGIIKQTKQPESIAKRSLANIGRVMSKGSIEKSARAKWKPVLCTELKISFLCMKFAAEFLNVRRTTISEAIKMNRKVLGKYTFIKVV